MDEGCSGAFLLSGAAMSFDKMDRDRVGSSLYEEFTCHTMGEAGTPPLYIATVTSSASTLSIIATNAATLAPAPDLPGYGELTRSVIIANPTDPELALDNHRSYFPGGPFFPAPIMERGRQELRVAANRASIRALDQKLWRPEAGVTTTTTTTTITLILSSLFLSLSLSLPRRRDEMRWEVALCHPIPLFINGKMHLPYNPLLDSGDPLTVGTSLEKKKNESVISWKEDMLAREENGRLPCDGGKMVKKGMRR
ncbi:hypothetical protein PIB30_056249 [Stylosanthes scabra]|uniref:Uncharacterized protein n=1 Tax=Stylosanthes scabra TaxID=79078 RepID=A0ABU6WHP7_9FABA|nr:hypothetical protein [Stylosanthes scabra]